MVEGKRIHVRPDMDLVYYFLIEGEDDMKEPGWYFEGTERVTIGPFNHSNDALRALPEVQGGPYYGRS